MDEIVVCFWIKRGFLLRDLSRILRDEQLILLCDLNVFFESEPFPFEVSLIAIEEGEQKPLKNFEVRLDEKLPIDLENLMVDCSTQDLILQFDSEGEMDGSKHRVEVRFKRFAGVKGHKTPRPYRLLECE